VTAKSFAVGLPVRFNRSAIRSGPAGRHGIIGTIDFSVEYARPKPHREDNDGATGETMVDALKDQLGLKLVSVKALIQIPVVDRLEQPTNN
jgi:uncharacterized protein (TIGR03435 family)